MAKRPQQRTRAESLVLAAASVTLLGGALWLFMGRSSEDPTPGAPDPPYGGAEIYAEHCASCHGGALEGEEGWRDARPDGSFPAPPHDASGHTWHHPDSQLFEITKFGGQVTAPPGFQSNMPGFQEVLSDPEIWAVLEFIKSRWPEEQREFQEAVTQRRPPR